MEDVREIKVLKDGGIGISRTDHGKDPGERTAAYGVEFNRRYFPCKDRRCGKGILDRGVDRRSVYN